MNVSKVVSLLLLSFVLAVPVAWGEESAVADPAQAASPKDPEQTQVAEVGEEKEASAPAGQDPQEDAITHDDLQGIRAEIETLRDQWKRAYDRKTAVTTRSLNFGGTVQTRFTQPVDNPGAKNSFSVPSLILKFAGNLKKDYDEGKNVDYVFSVNSNSDFTLRPLDAYIGHSILRSNDLEQPYLYIYLGQQKKPFGLEALATEEFKPTIRSAQFVAATKINSSTLVNAGGLGLEPRDIGVVVTGDLFPYVDSGFKYRVPAVWYSLGVFNGTGLNKADDNNQKDLSGRIVFNAPVDYNDAFRGLSLGFSGYKGRKNATAVNTATTIANALPATGSAPIPVTTTRTSTISKTGDSNRWGADLSYVNTPVGFTLEYARGEDDVISDSSVTTTNGGAPVTRASRTRNIKSEGYTFTLFYNFGEQFLRQFKAQERYDDWYPLTYQPFVRFDRYDADLDNTGQRTDIWTLGFNWFFAETTKLQLNYNIKTSNTAQPDSSEFLAQFQYGF